MMTVEELARGRTLAEAQGFTAEMGQAVAILAGDAIEAGRLEAAREILEGLAVTNPRDPVAWALLSAVCRRQGQVEAARLCAEVAVRLAPSDPRVRLVRAEALLAGEVERAEGRRELQALAVEEGGVGARARQLVAAMG